MFQRILVPFDGSKHAEAGLKMAVEIAALTRAEITILTVFRHHSMLEASFSMVRATEPGNVEDAMRAHARDVADHAKKIALDAGAKNVRAFIKEGQPARTIVAWAMEKDVDLIVLTSRGMGSIEGYLLGSVSSKVTALAECPVLVV